MDYNEFYSPFKQREKGVKETLQRQQSVFKGISKNAAKGDLKALIKDLNTMKVLISEHEGYLKEIQEMTEGFDARAYMENGDFAKQMLSYCEKLGVDVEGSYPAYEIFPYKVKIDGDSQEIYINGRKMQCVRPEYFVTQMKKNREKLMKANFNASVFLNELAGVYDSLEIIKRKETQSSKRNLELLLKDIYHSMTPMQRFRRDYDMQSFAFDLSRLYSSDAEFTNDGRQYSFGSARRQSQMIRILDKNGSEAFIGTITFFSKEPADETVVDS